MHLLIYKYCITSMEKIELQARLVTAFTLYPKNSQLSLPCFVQKAHHLFIHPHCSPAIIYPPHNRTHSLVSYKDDRHCDFLSV